MEIVDEGVVWHCALGYKTNTLPPAATAAAVGNWFTSVFAIVVRDRNTGAHQLRCFYGNQNVDAKYSTAASIAQAATSGRLVDVIKLHSNDVVGEPLQNNVVRINTRERTVFLGPRDDTLPILLQTILQSLSNTNKPAIITKINNARGGARNSGSGMLSRLRLSGGNFRKTLSSSSSFSSSSSSSSSSPSTMPAWQTDFDFMLHDPHYRKLFHSYLKFAHAEENLDFYIQVEEFELTANESERQILFASMMEEQRQVQIRNMSGSFAKLWDTTGVDAYNSIKRHLLAQVQEWRNVSVYFESRLGNVELAMAGEHELYITHSVKDGNLLAQPHTTSHAVYVAVEASKMRERYLSAYLKEMQAYVVRPIHELRNTVEESVREILSRYARKVEEIEQARWILIQCEKHLHSLEKESMEFQLEVASQSTGGGNSKSKKKKGGAGKAKAIKAQEQKAEKMVSNITEQETNLENARIAFVSVESEHSEVMKGAMDELESLELHRLETQYQILSQAALVEQSLYKRLGLGVQAVVSDALQLDPLAEVVDLARTMSQAANQFRPKTVKVTEEFKGLGLTPATIVSVEYS